jgi:hypothetical protein
MVAFAGNTGGLSVGIEPHQFFKAQPVKRAVERAERRYLRQAGGYTRRVAQTSIKKRGGARTPPREFKADGKTHTKAWVKWRAEKQHRPASAPGTPPFSHSRRRVNLRAAIRWGLTAGEQSALVGPYAHWRLTSKIWQLHEFGGTRRLWIFRGEHGTILFTHHRSRAGRRGKTTAESFTARYEPRPFMGPALRKATPRLPRMWKDSVR